MADRRCGAREILQMLGIMLVTEHVRRPAAFQRRADAIGAGELLGIAETRQQLNAVKVPPEVAIGRQPVKQHAARIGQHDAERLAPDIVAQVLQHRQGVAGQRGVQVGIADVKQVDVAGGDVPPPGAPPRRQDRVTHPARSDRLTCQETLPGLGQPGIRHVWPDDSSARHMPPCLPLPLSRAQVGHRRPQPGARHCERHEHGPDDDRAGACAPPAAPDSWPPPRLRSGACFGRYAHL